MARIRSIKPIPPGHDIPRYHPVRRLVWERDGGRCCYCGAALLNPPFEGAAREMPELSVFRNRATLEEQGRLAEIDHVTPLELGGDSSPDNLATACRNCNRSKGPRTILGWLCKLRAA